MDNKLIEIQKILFNQLKRIDNDNLSQEELLSEVSRSNAIANNASAFIKAVNINIRTKELSQKYQTTQEQINKELGL